MNRAERVVLPYYSPDYARAENIVNVDNFEPVVNLLNDSRLQEQILFGNVTLCMIRPNVGPDANNQGLPDNTCAEEIENMIDNLGVMAKFSFMFSEAAVRKFYAGGPQHSMESETAKNPGKYTSRWTEFIDNMTSGPTTALLLHSNRGDAIEQWRSHLGHWNIDEVRDYSTIRGKLGVNKYNNLVHGSDSPDSVLRELEIIKATISKL